MDIVQNKFAFFSNFAETIKQLPEEKQGDAYKAICEYGIYGILPDDILLKSICLIAQNSIFKNEGGAPKGNKNASKKEKTEEEKQPQNNIKTTLKQPTFHETETRNKKQETETESETESILISSDKSSEIKTDSSKTSKNYAFEGKIIHLTQKDFDRWKKAYPDLNLWGELMLRDDWLSKQPPESVKDWFISTSQYFLKQNELRKRQNAELEEKIEEPKTSVFDEPKKEHDWSWV